MALALKDFRGRFSMLWTAAGTTRLAIRGFNDEHELRKLDWDWNLQHEQE